MNILVIGGAGYIGSHVVKELLEKGYKVKVYDNLSRGQKINIFPESTFYQADILDYDTLVKALSNNIDAVVHLAAFKAAGESMLEPEKYSINNITGTLNILNACCQAGIEILVFSSSAAVYGEPEYLPIDENHPTNPENYYGYTKLAIEGFLKWYDKLKGIKFGALRYFNAAGYDPEEKIVGLEKNPANLLPVLMEVAIGRREKLQIFGEDYNTPDGTGVRDYIHVTDLAKAHVLAIEKLKKEKQSFIVNLGSEKGISVLEMLEVSRKITQQEIPIEIMDRRPGDTAELFATSKKAAELLNWKPNFSDLEMLVKTTWNIYKKYI